jgi:hypothetical protein
MRHHGGNQQRRDDDHDAKRHRRGCASPQLRTIADSDPTSRTPGFMDVLAAIVIAAERS